MKSQSPTEILLVEDDPRDVELTRRSLEKEKLCNTIHVVRDGAEALDFIFGRGAYQHRLDGPNPYLVLLDLKLPKVDGLEVLRQMKENSRTKMVPVIVLTSSREQKDLVESYRLGVNSYIQKPVDFAQFQSAVKEIGLYWLLLNQVPAVESTPRAAPPVPAAAGN
ncbi:MAG TPA: response regulator [Terriglobales bacterium]|nr:response regulator [Terriglobales bacterium]